MINQIKMTEIHSITLEEAMEIYKEMKVTFIIKDGKLRGLSLERNK